MYSTSSIKTRATWTAFPYNIAWSDETGHFQYCSQVDTGTGKCTGDEGAGASKGPADKDDFGCFPASAATRDPIAGCIAPNYGFDGPPYQRDWPNGSKSRPTPIMFSSPLTGRKFNVNYARECAGCAAAVRRGRLRQPELRHLHRDRLHQAAHHRRRHAGQVLPVLLHHARGRLYLGPGHGRARPHSARLREAEPVRVL